nr:Uncharacterised protein [Klebsiella pneumoniae]
MLSGLAHPRDLTIAMIHGLPDRTTESLTIKAGFIRRWMVEMFRQKNWKLLAGEWIPERSGRNMKLRSKTIRALSITALIAVKSY